MKSDKRHARHLAAGSHRGMHMLAFQKMHTPLQIMVSCEAVLAGEKRGKWKMT